MFSLNSFLYVFLLWYIVYAQDFPAVELNALDALFINTNGNNWNWTNKVFWNFSVPDPNPCTQNWYGIDCNCTSITCNVQSVMLDKMNLDGVLPPQLGNLTELIALDFDQNPSLAGSLPDEITNLAQLQFLIIASTNLTGTIPSSIGNLKSLIALVLNANKLEGSIPVGIGGLKSLEYLYLHHNSLTGTIPSSIGNLTTLTDLELNYNFLNGSIPYEIGNLGKLTDLYLNGNNLIGSIPSSFSNFLAMQNLWLYKNKLTGTIPSSIGSLTPLKTLFLYSNSLNGSIPSSFISLKNLLKLRLYENSLVGKIPSFGSSGSSALTELLLYDNQLTGTIPSSLWSLPLRNLQLDSNRLNGTIPEITRVSFLFTFISFNYNNLTGPIPASFVNVKGLRSLWLNNNRLTGNIPNLQSLTGLNQFYLQWNQLAGTIPSWLGSLQYLQYVGLDHNLLTGILPYQLGNMKNVLELTLNDNQLIGTIPNLSGCLALYGLNLTNNYLNGTIPASLGSVSKLILLYMAHNSFTGAIPGQLRNLVYLGYLDLSYNKLNGSFPDFSNTNLVALRLAFNQLSGSIINDNLNNLAFLDTFIVNHNYFTGEIPSNLFNSPLLDEMILSDNYFQGNLPTTITSPMKSLLLSNNYLTGMIPSTFFNEDNCLFVDLLLDENLLKGQIPNSLNNCPFLQSIILTNNQFTGKFLEMESLYELPLLSFLFLANNSFSGSISSSISNLYFLLDFNISSNAFTGSLPSELSSLPYLLNIVLDHNQLIGKINGLFISQYLSYLKLNHNHFHGSINNLIDSSYQVLIIQIDISYNRFTNTIPSEIFQLPSLNTFIAAVNCLDTKIPADICQAPMLNTIVLDGLQSANGCSSEISYQSIFSSSYTVKTSSSIPSCLFSMSTLKTLHLSGNGFTGSIPKNIQLPNKPSYAYDLTLSHNALTGTIPSEIFTINRTWMNLDLSFNKFTGEIPSNSFPIPNNGSLSLDINRLSGNIPSTYMNTEDISILNGNLFSCNNYDPNDLPKNDPVYDSYECGSDSVNNSLIIWIGIITLIALVLLGYSLIHQLSFYQHWSILQIWWNQANYQRKYHYLMELMKLFHSLRMGLGFITSFVLVIFMPVYGSLGVYYGSYSNQYIWTVSSGFLSGIAPATILFLFFFIFLSFLFFLVNQYLSSLFIPQKKVQSNAVSSSSCWSFSLSSGLYSLKSFWKDHWDWFLVIGFVLFDMIIVIVVNGAYVYAVYQNLTRFELQFLSLLLAFFKILWSSIVVIQIFGKYMNNLFVNKLRPLPITENMVYSIEMMVLNALIFLSIFNNVIVPYVVSAFISPNCFLYFFTNSPDVNTSFLPATIYLTHLEGTGHVIDLLGDVITTSISFQPPFLYSYTCNASLLTNFVYVFIYRYILTGLIQPIVSMIILWAHGKYYHSSARQKKAIPMDSSSSSFSSSCWSSCASYLDWLGLLLIPKLWKIALDEEDARNLHQPPNTTPVISNNLKSPLLPDNSTMTIPAETEITSNNQEGGGGGDVVEDIRLSLLKEFNKKRFLVNLVSDLTIAMTFGVMFPLLFIVIVFTICMGMIDLQLSIGRLLKLSEIIPNKIEITLKVINEEFHHITEYFHHYVFVILQVSVFFWGLNVFDTLGDEIGGMNALWIFFMMICSPWIIICLQYLWKKIISSESVQRYKSSFTMGLEFGRKSELPTVILMENPLANQLSPQE